MAIPGLHLFRARPGRPPDRTAPGGPPADLLAAARGVLAGEVTALSDGKERPGVPRLVVTAGPRKGSEFALLGRVTTIGRGVGNAISIPDVSMSRRHSRLERRGSVWLVFDQGSGNGTSVNGKPARRRRLRHGDEISVGDTALRFVEPFGVLVRTERSAPPRGPVAAPPSAGGPALLRVAVALAALMVLGALIVRHRRAAAQAEGHARAQASRALAQARLREGVALVKQGSWVAGRDKLRVAAELSNDAEAVRELEAAEIEAPRAEALGAARAALRRQDFDAAREALGRIPAGSALADEARVVESALPPAASPQQQAPAASSDPESRDRREVREILEAHGKGELADAVERARAAHGGAGRELLAPLARLASAWRAGVAERDPAAAIRSLDEALWADRAIGGGRGRVARRLRKALAARHLVVAATFTGDDDLPRAAAHLRAAVQADPESAEANGRLQQLSLRAGQVYLRAYVAREEDPQHARAAFRAVAESLPATDALAQKARRWLSVLEGKESK